MTDKEAMKLALDALIAATPVKAKDPQMQAVAIVALQEALAQPEQEPVQEPKNYRHTWGKDGEGCVICGDKDWMNTSCKPLAPQRTEQEPVANELTQLKEQIEMLKYKLWDCEEKSKPMQGQ